MFSSEKIFAECQNKNELQVTKIKELCGYLGSYCVRYYEIVAKETSGRKMLEQMKETQEQSLSKPPKFKPKNN